MLSTPTCSKAAVFLIGLHLELVTFVNADRAKGVSQELSKRKERRKTKRAFLTECLTFSFHLKGFSSITTTDTACHILKKKKKKKRLPL